MLRSQVAPQLVLRRAATAAEWDTHWRGCEYATYFHSRAWAEAWQRYSSGRRVPAPLLLRFSDDVEAVLPLTEELTHRGFGRLTWSSPAGTFGGWISRNRLELGHAHQLAEVLGERGNLIWRLNPYDPLARAVVRGHLEPEVTKAIPLAAGFDTVVRTWRKGHRAAAKQAERAGVVVRRAQSISDWRTYFALYQANLARWGARATSRYGWELFAALVDAGDDVELQLAWHGERVIAGALCLAAPRHVAYWHGATDVESLALRPVHLLVREAIRAAIARGALWFDMNPSGAHEGVAAFKDGFCPTELPAPLLRGRSFRTRALDRIAGALRRLPI